MRTPLLCLAAVLLFVCGQAAANTTRTQEIQITRGWNAVFLEVYAENPDPAAVFAGTPVDIAASHFTRSGSAQFVTDPGSDMFKKAGWGVWFAESRPDAFLKTLHAIHGQQGYLIHSRSDFTWRVSGAVTVPDVKWQPNAFNFVGFGVHAQGAPTFAQFFGGSKAHRHNKIYRLANGSWRRVNDPSAEPMRSGEAFWIYADGNSTYTGPVAIATTTKSGVLLSTGADDLTLRNATTHPVAATIEHVAPATNALPLALVVQVSGATGNQVRTAASALPEGNWSQPLPPLEPGTALRVPLQLRAGAGATGNANAGANATASGLLKITTDLGTETWIPVLGLRRDLTPN